MKTITFPAGHPPESDWSAHLTRRQLKTIDMFQVLVLLGRVQGDYRIRVTIQIGFDVKATHKMQELHS